MSIRNSKVYNGFKAFNGILFAVLGTVLIVRVLSSAGPHATAIPGVLMGAALAGLGVHRTILLLRLKKWSHRLP